MNTLPYLIAALALLPALAAAAWAWRTMNRAESALRGEAGLDRTDFEIGTWPQSARVR